jgi:CRP/FNR family transcriptional regulator
MYEELKYWYLRDHKLFWTLNGSQLKQLCIITGFKKAKKGEIIYFSSSELPRVFLLKKGNIKIVSVDEDGNETIKDIIQKNQKYLIKNESTKNQNIVNIFDEILNHPIKNSLND